MAAWFDYTLLVLLTLVSLGLYYVIAFGLWRLCTLHEMYWARERMIVGELASLVGLELPLGAGLPLAAAGCRGAVRRRLEQLGRLLRQGLPLPQALAIGFPQCSGMVRSLIAAGERAGRLPAAIRQAEAWAVRREESSRPRNTGVRPYALVIGLATLATLTVLMVLVVPKYEELVVDFDTQLPSATRWLLAAAKFMLPLASLLAAAILTTGPTLLYLELRPRRPERLTRISRAADWLRWYVPFCRRYAFAGGMAEVLVFLREALAAGMPLPQAAALAADLDVNWQLRRRLLVFAHDLARGEPASPAARRAGLGAIVARVLAGRPATRDIDAGLRFAAEYYASLFSRAWLLLRQIALPVTVIGLGLIVGGVAVAMLLPLVALLDAVARGVGL